MIIVLLANNHFYNDTDYDKFVQMLSFLYNIICKNSFFIYNNVMKYLSSVHSNG